MRSKNFKTVAGLFTLYFNHFCTCITNNLLFSWEWEFTYRGTEVILEFPIGAKKIFPGEFHF